jgi:hypothetical protein
MMVVIWGDDQFVRDAAHWHDGQITCRVENVVKCRSLVSRTRIQPRSLKSPRDVICSLPPCGGEVERGVTSSDVSGLPPSLTLPRKGGGNAPSSGVRAMMARLTMSLI